MDVSCIFYGFTNQARKIELLIDEILLRPGEVVTYGGHDYIILNVLKTKTGYMANVTPQRPHRLSLAEKYRREIQPKEASSTLEASDQIDDGEAERLLDRLIKEVDALNREIERELYKSSSYRKSP
ncbi:MAG: hypothetical protein HY731_08575 [Candidatus Tectomicrobia bacterium]|nr:hypothetical protein [Candidatus Tectomicrobia bacterium]